MSKSINRRTLKVLLALLCVFTKPLWAQEEIPACSHQYSDADGDGFGWENSASCIITIDSEPPPTYINEETGLEVELVRPNWDGNSDFVNRVIECQLYLFDDANQRYIPDPDDYVARSSLHFEHLPLPSSEPYQGHVFPNVPTNSFSYWTISDGLYNGSNLLNDPYIELIENANGVKSIRTWEYPNATPVGVYDFPYISSYHSDWSITPPRGYYQCEDVSGSDFMPTGSPGEPTSQPYELADLTLSVRANDGESTDEVIDLRTGLPVVQEKIYWNYNEDLAASPLGIIGCQSYEFSEGGNTYIQGHADAEYYYYIRAFEGADVGNLRHRTQFEGIESTYITTHTNGIVEPEFRSVFSSDKAEILSDSSIRLWTSSQYHILCWNVQPTGAAPDGAVDSETIADLNEDNTNVSSDEVQDPPNDDLETNSPTAPSTGSGAISFWPLFSLQLLVCLRVFSNGCARRQGKFGGQVLQSHITLN